MGIFLSTQELRTIYDNFDLNNDGGISYTELTHVLRVSNPSHFDGTS
jgi:Ca2+-binding EF-hand superfamily protein